MTRYIGLKFTHDAAVALIEDGVLKWSIELEKRDNNERYTEAMSLWMVRKALDEEGFEFGKDDLVCIDGWRAGKILRPVEMDVAGYWPDVSVTFTSPSPFMREALRLHEHNCVFSTPHVSGHVFGAYVMSPHAGHECDVLMWDGGTRPMLYHMDPHEGLTGGSPLLNLYGTLYGIMGYYAGPFKVEGHGNLGIGEYSKMIGRRDWPGKLMSWIGNGLVQPDIVEACERAHHMLSDTRRPDVYLDQRGASAFNDSRPENNFMHLLMAHIRDMEFPDSDVLRSIHEWIGNKLVEGLSKHKKTDRLIFVGGSALNIKWNSMMRDAGFDIWVPPCPNDSGSAIGAAAAARWHNGEKTPLAWQVYCGPKMAPPNLQIDQMPYSAHPKWKSSPMLPANLGWWLHENPEKIVCVLHGRAEIGPRALGHRSLLMNATVASNKNKLNVAKGREPWRPVAPIVLEEHAQKLFEPGTPDPFMLFDHKITDYCEDAYPAIRHIDWTARIQTVGALDCNITRMILQGYAEASKGEGILCNTSANRNGSGFFPDLASADRWGADYIWHDNVLWTRHGAK